MGLNEAAIDTAVQTEGQNDVADRLAAIAAAVAERTQLGAQSAPKNTSEGMACPIDPAERALCDSCQ